MSKKRKKSFFEYISSDEVDYEMLRPFLGLDQKYILWVVRNMQRLRRNASFLEENVGKFMYHRRIIFVSQAPFLFDLGLAGMKCYFADFYIPALCTIIEIDGKNHKGSAEYDSMRDSLFADMGISTIRISNSSVAKGEYKKLIPMPDEEFLRPEKVRYIPEDIEYAAKDAMLRGLIFGR